MSNEQLPGQESAFRFFRAEGIGMLSAHESTNQIMLNRASGRLTGALELQLSSSW